MQPETPFVKSPNVSNSAKYNIPVDELLLDSEALMAAFVNHVQHTQGKHPSAATRLDQALTPSPAFGSRLRRAGRLSACLAFKRPPVAGRL